MMDNIKPYAVVVVIQLIFSGLYLISKVAFDEGMSTFIYIFYRQVVASLLLVPLAFIFERRTAPSLSFSVLIKIFLLSFGITFFLNTYSIGLSYTSPMIVSAAPNSIPVITFFCALLLRMETLKLKSSSGMVKMIGVAVCFCGVIVLSFYVGPHLNSVNHHHLLSHSKSHHPQSKTTWIVGALLIILTNVVFALWIVLQGLVLKVYPSKLMLTTLQCVFSMVQSFFVALAFEKDIKRWKLSFNVSLLSVVYSGLMVTGLAFYLQTWCLEKKGPVFLAMFKPLSLLFTLFTTYFILGDVIHVGSMIGGIIMIGGLYCVLWGKNKEIVMINQPIIED